MAQLCQYPTERRARGLLWLLNFGPEALRRGLSLAAVTPSNIGDGIHTHGRLIVSLGMSSIRQRPAA